MKKLLISLLLINLFSVGVMAETYTGSHSISLGFSVEPTYSVKIPKSLNISENTTSFNYYVSGDIYADQKLKIDYDSVVNISSKNKSCPVYISLSKSEFTQNELSKEYISYVGSINHSKLESGEYTGRLNVVISLVGGA